MPFARISCSRAVRKTALFALVSLAAVSVACSDSLGVDGSDDTNELDGAAPVDNDGGSGDSSAETDAEDAEASVDSGTDSGSDAHAGAWEPGEWEMCSVACGGGTQTRTITCRREEVDVDESACLETAPATSRACNTDPCGEWVSSDWTACSVACEGGTQTRTNQCQRDGADVDESLCLTAPPSTSQACNTDACGAWVSSAWGACSGSCGGGEGTQTRTNECQRDGAAVDASLCLDAPPATSQSCTNDDVCPLIDVGATSNNGTCGVLGVLGPGFLVTAGSTAPLPAGTTITITGSGVPNIGVFSVTGDSASATVTELSATSRLVTLTAPLAASAVMSIRTTLLISVAFTLDASMALPDGYTGTGSKLTGNVTSTRVLCSAS